MINRSLMQTVIPCTILANVLVLAGIGETMAADKSGAEFFSLVKTNFGQWDLNHDTILTGDEIATALQNPRIGGRDAAALAALKVKERFSIRDSGTYASYSRGDIATLEAGYASDEKDAKELVSFYKQGLEKLSKQAPQLFSSECAHINGIKQGHTSDCYFLSVVGSLVTRDPLAIRRIIQANENGTYTVQFKNAAPIQVNAPTAGEIATYADSGGDGFWLTVLEKAYGVLKSQSDYNHAPPIEPLDEVTTHGGPSVDVIYALTGHQSKHYNLKDPRVQREIRQILSSAANERRLVTTKVPGHCLSMIRYNDSSDSLEIWNPWGSTKFYKEAGAMMQDGLFTLSVDDFLSRCVGLYVEQDR